MTASLTTRRPGLVSMVMIVTSIGLSIALSLALDWFLFITPSAVMDAPALMFPLNATAILQSVVGSIIEWRRPGHAIGRLLMLSGPLYAALAMGWSNDAIAPWVDPAVHAALAWGTAILSYPGVALLAGWLPLLFPTGTLPGPRWRIPAAALIVMSSISLAALAFSPGAFGTTEIVNPIGIEGWPSALKPVADAINVEMAALLILAIAGLATRYRRGDRVERLQIRWLLAALAVTTVGFIGVMIELALRTDGGVNISAFIAYAGILLMPIAIGMAILRYRLYEIDRIISRTIGYALVTGVLVVVFIGGVLGLQTIFEPLTGGNTVAVAASTLIAAALFQPLRRRIQGAVDRRFDRARYDGQKVIDAFTRQLRDEVDLDRLRTALVATADEVVRPMGASVWLRRTETGS
jgi:hypothetical protein